MPDRFTLPPVGAPSTVAFPAIDRRVLSNGLRVWAVQQSAVPAVTVVLMADAGTAVDPADRPGLASLTASLLTEGAGTLDSIALADAFSRIGGQLATEVATDTGTVALTVLARHFDRGLALLADMVQRPTLGADDFARVQDLRLGRLRQVALTPAAAADRALLSAVYGDHPYGHGALGTTRSVETMSVDEVRRCWSDRWRPASATILIVGDIDVRDAHARVAAAFDRWNGSTTPATPVPAPVRLANGGLRVVDRPGAPQSEIRVGQLGPPRKTPDFHALVAFNALLGGQFTSRINRNLRETRAITYAARSSFDMRRAGGIFACEASVQADATAIALTEVVREIRDAIPDGAITLEELNHSRTSLTRGYVRHFETAAQLARAMAELATYSLPDDTYDRFVPGLEALTVHDLTSAARAALQPEDSTLVVVGDLEQIGKSLEGIGRPVTRVTPEF